MKNAPIANKKHPISLCDFYTMHDDRIVVLRVLHQSCDIPAHSEP